MRTRWGILISGNGSTLQSFLDARDSIDVGVVISSKAGAYGLARAQRSGVPVEIVPAEFKGPLQRPQAEKWIVDTLKKYNVQKVFLAGFMRIISPEFIGHFEGDIFNVHPSLLPKYKGLNAFGEALKAGDKKAGVTIHRVAKEVDSGEIISQRIFDIPEHREETLSHLWLHINEQRMVRETLAKIGGRRPQW